MNKLVRFFSVSTVIFFFKQTKLLMYKYLHSSISWFLMLSNDERS